MRSIQSDAALHRVGGPAAKLAKVDSNRPVGISLVRHCALGETAVIQFFDRISIRDPAKLIEAPGRTPAAAVDSMYQRNIERRAIHAGLSSGNNSQVAFAGSRLRAKGLK